MSAKDCIEIAKLYLRVNWSLEPKTDIRSAISVHSPSIYKQLEGPNELWSVLNFSK